MRRYMPANAHGPFFPAPSGSHDDEAVVDPATLRTDWTQLRALHHLFTLHHVNSPHAGAGAGVESEYSFIPMSMPFCQPVLDDGRDERDWVGIGGLWRMTTSFVGQRALQQLNNVRVRLVSKVDVPQAYG
jgi:hypothetical protein